MNAKRILFVVAALAALCAQAFDDVQVVYRGKLQKKGEKPEAGEVPVEFKLYTSKGAATAFWSQTTNVLLDAEGRFQVALRGDGLADALDEAGTAWIGVTVDGGSEQVPRQELTASPRAYKVELAEGLADSATIGSLETGTLEVETLKAAHVTATNSDSAISVETGATVSEHVVSKVNKLYIKGDVQFFSREDPTDLGTQTASGGGCSFGTADANCVVVFSATSTDWMPAASMFFKQGEEIAVPSAASLDDGTTVRAWKYNIGVE